jgi:hypothetical protein
MGGDLSYPRLGANACSLQPDVPPIPFGFICETAKSIGLVPLPLAGRG